MLPPRRGHVVIAKALALGTAVAVTSALAVAVAVTATLFILKIAGAQARWASSDTARISAATIWYLVGWAVLGQIAGWLTISKIGGAALLVTTCSS